MENRGELRYCLYARKSSEQDERQAMSIESQTKEMLEMAEQQGLNIVEMKHESHSAKESSQRPVFNELIEGLREEKFNALLTWAPDRLSRNAGDLGSLVDLMDQNKLQEIKTYSQNFTNSPNEKFLLMILCSQAKLENDNKSINVKRGIRAKCERGIRPGPSPMGYLNFSMNGAKDIMIDSERAPAITEMFERSADGQSGRAIKKWLDGSGYTTRKGKKITLSQVYETLNNPFYYGEFIFGNKTYQGTHEPLVSRELFEEVQSRLEIHPKGRWGAKDFPFKRFLRCAGCGSTIVGEEKFKNLKNGTRQRYVYYHCSRTVDYDCKEPYLREDTLVKSLLAMADELNAKSDEIEPRLLQEIEHFATIVRTVKEKHDPKEALHDYARYILKEGSEFELKRLIRNLKSEFAIKNRQIVRI